MRVIVKRSVLVSLTLLAPLSACPQPEPPPPITATTPEEAAMNALPTLERLVNETNYQDLGFSSVDEVRRATVGDPLPVMMVRLDELAEYTPDKDPMSLLHQESRTLVPVLVGGEVRTSTVVHTAGHEAKLAVGGFGGPTLIQSLERTRRASMAQTERLAASYFVVHVPSMSLYLLGYHEENTLMLIAPLNDPRFGLEAGEVIAARDLFVRLVPETRRDFSAPI